MAGRLTSGHTQQPHSPDPAFGTLCWVTTSLTWTPCRFEFSLFVESPGIVGQRLVASTFSQITRLSQFSQIDSRVRAEFKDRKVHRQR
jgi:hypothetical protein